MNFPGNLTISDQVNSMQDEFVCKYQKSSRQIFSKQLISFLGNKLVSGKCSTKLSSKHKSHVTQQYCWIVVQRDNVTAILLDFLTRRPKNAITSIIPSGIISTVAHSGLNIKNSKCIPFHLISYNHKLNGW